MVVGPQGSLALAVAVAADHFLHLAVGVEQALLTGPSLGPTAPEGSKEPMASLTQVGREEGAQFLPVEEGRSMRLCGWWLAGGAKFSVWASSRRGGRAGHRLPGDPTAAISARDLKKKSGDGEKSQTQAHLRTRLWLEVSQQCLDHK